jgi:hypothetical protein
MERPFTFLIGFSVAVLSFVVRLNTSGIFTHFKYGKDAVLSPQYIDLQAWADILLVLMLSGVALMLIGWFYPKRRAGEK